MVTHYEDDHSWAFIDGKPFDPTAALLVSMSEVVDRHPELVELASLPPGWSVHRSGVGLSWCQERDVWAEG